MLLSRLFPEALSDMLRVIATWPQSEETQLFGTWVLQSFGPEGLKFPRDTLQNWRHGKGEKGREWKKKPSMTSSAKVKH